MEKKIIKAPQKGGGSAGPSDKNSIDPIDATGNFYEPVKRGKGGLVKSLSGANFDWGTIERIENLIKEAISDEFGSEVIAGIPILVTIPTESSWGDYTTNVSMHLSKALKQSPFDIASKIQYRILEKIKKLPRDDILGSVSVASSGYINFTISPSTIKGLLNFLILDDTSYGTQENRLKNNYLEGKNVIVEYTDPNPFKVFHIGHLVPNAVGESLSRMFEFCGANVKRVNYQGDVGMHVAKAIYGVLVEFANSSQNDDLDSFMQMLASLPIQEKMNFLGKCYALGASFYEEEEKKALIQKINAWVYVIAQEMVVKEYGWEPKIDYKSILSAEYSQGVPLELSLSHFDKKSSDKNSNVSNKIIDIDAISKIYLLGRKWSLDYFETIYKALGTRFDHYYFESMAGEFGYSLVREFLGSVFEEDNGAVVFKGEDYGLHTRVFINSKGLPTYEAKDLGLVFLKQKDYDYSDSFIITGSEQSAYFKVIFKALEKIDPILSKKTHHVAHGMLNLSTGKMSSRKGDVISVEELLGQLSSLALEKMSLGGEDFSDYDSAQKIAVAALKYSILKQQLGKDIVYDREKSLQLQGDTGPYLQYSYVRAYSVLEKAKEQHMELMEVSQDDIEDFSPCERDLVRHLAHFNEVVIKATKDISPSYICTYLHELSGKFNTFYASSKIIDSEEPKISSLRLSITKAFLVVLGNGLNLLGIEPIKKM